MGIFFKLSWDLPLFWHTTARFSHLGNFSILWDLPLSWHTTLHLFRLCNWCSGTATVSAHTSTPVSIVQLDAVEYAIVLASRLCKTLVLLNLPMYWHTTALSQRCCGLCRCLDIQLYYCLSRATWFCEIYHCPGSPPLSQLCSSLVLWHLQVS